MYRRNIVKQTEHYKDRYGERVCSKTRRGQLFADRAFWHGRDIEQVKDARLKRYMREHQQAYDGRVVKIYNGQLYVFFDEIAITVFPLPNKLRGLI